MRKTSSQLRKPRTTVSDDTDLTPQQYRELRRRIKYFDNPVRYVVYADPFRRHRSRLFLDVSTDLFCLGGWSQATLFKQKRIACLVAKAYSVQQQRTLQVARVIMKVGKRKASRAPKSKR